MQMDANMKKQEELLYPPKKETGWRIGVASSEFSYRTILIPATRKSTPCLEVCDGMECLPHQRLQQHQNHHQSHHDQDIV